MSDFELIPDKYGNIDLDNPHLINVLDGAATIDYLSAQAEDLRMEPVTKYDGMIDYLSDAFLRRYKRKDVNLTGIMFVRPESAFAKKEILPHISYWHHVSDCYTDFFCPGYFDEEDAPQDKTKVTEVAGKSWYFSQVAFADFLEQLEPITKWRYSGGCDLLITNVHYNEKANQAKLDLSSAISIPLEQAIEDKAFPHVAGLYETIFQFAKSMNDSIEDPCWEYSDQQGLRVVKGSLKPFFLAFLPDSLKQSAKKAFHIVTQDLRPDKGMAGSKEPDLTK